MSPSNIHSLENPIEELYTVATDMSLDTQTKKEQFLQIGLKQLGLEYGFITEISDGIQKIVESTTDGNLGVGSECSIDQSYCQQTIQTDSIYATSDVINSTISEEAYELFGLERYIGGKILINNELYGTFCFASEEKSDEEFTEEDKQFVKLASKWISYEMEQDTYKERLKEQSVQLRNQRNILKSLNEVVCHDISNNMQVAQGYLKLIQSMEKLSDESEEYVENIDQSLQQATGIMNDMGNITDAVIDNKIFEEKESLESIVSKISEESLEKYPTLTIETDLHEYDISGADLLKTVIRNLIENSVNHNPDKNITVSIESTELENNSVQISVSDNGCGISTELDQSIFQKNISTKNDSNSGQGLYICRTITRILGGDITYSDNDKSGVTFTIVLEN